MGPGGHFEIEFRADGLNSMVCEWFPAKKASWRIKDVETETPTVHIDWDKYGKYELKMAPDGESMAGSAEGHPAQWRKAERLRGLDEKPSPMSMALKKRDREGCGGCKKGCGGCGREDD